MSDYCITVCTQNEYECFFIIADLHTLTTRSDKAAVTNVSENIHELLLDYLSVGIGPGCSVIFLQSGVPETYELNLIFEMLVSVPRLERVPNIKDMAKVASLESLPFTLLGYPVLQAADILLPRATYVLVGKDNEAHVEVKRLLAAALNVFLDPIRDRRSYFKARPSMVEEILAAGTERMRAEACETMVMVREAMGIRLPGDGYYCCPHQARF